MVRNLLLRVTIVNVRNNICVLVLFTLIYGCDKPPPKEEFSKDENKLNVLSKREASAKSDTVFRSISVSGDVKKNWCGLVQKNATVADYIAVAGGAFYRFESGVELDDIDDIDDFVYFVYEKKENQTILIKRRGECSNAHIDDELSKAISIIVKVKGRRRGIKEK